MTTNSRFAGDSERLCAEGLASGLDPAKVLKFQEILDLMHLSDVPRNNSLIKGVVSGPSKSIPLMDLRINLSAGNGDRTDRACAVIVDVEGVQIGVLLEPGLEA